MNTDLTPSGLAVHFDHAQLQAYTAHGDSVKLYGESMEYGFKMVVISPAQVVRYKELLRSNPVHVGAAIGLPLGQTIIVDKIDEIKTATENGSDEINYVIDITELKEKNHNYIEKEMAGIVDICRENHIISKVIFENCYFTETEKEELCKIALNVESDFVRTSTGLGTRGAALEDIILMRRVVGGRVMIKAAGGVRDLDTVPKLIDLGVSRIGPIVGTTTLEEYKSRLQDWLIHTKKRSDMIGGDLSGAASGIPISDHQGLWGGVISGLSKSSLLKSENKTPNRKNEHS